MSDARHTPPPWRASEDPEDARRWSVFSLGVPPHRPPAGGEFCGWHVATVENGAPGDMLETEAANARLIAASPELLAACEAMLAAWADPNALDARVEALRAARAAVAKAKGATP